MLVDLDASRLSLLNMLDKWKSPTEVAIKAYLEIAGEGLFEVFAPGAQNTPMKIPCFATTADLDIGELAGPQKSVDPLT